MSSSEPKPGKCGAKKPAKRGGGFCENPPAPGKKRCRFHGGADRVGAPPIHGRYSDRFKRIGPVAQAAIDDALRDGDLLDVRRPVALQTVIVQDAPLIPTDEILREFAMRLSRWRPAEGQTWEDQPEPGEIDLQLARMTWLEQASNLTELYAATLARAAKTAALSDALTKQIIPIFVELGGRMTKLAARFVEPGKREDFDAAFRMEVRAVVAETLALENE